MDTPSEPRKPLLSDVLASVVTAVARARVSADLNSVEIARLYQSHEHLRSVPVPRLRIHRIHVDLPVVVTGHRAAQLPVLAESGMVAREIIRAYGKSIGVEAERRAEADEQSHLRARATDTAQSTREEWQYVAELADLSQALLLPVLRDLFESLRKDSEKEYKQLVAAIERGRRDLPSGRDPQTPMYALDVETTTSREVRRKFERMLNQRLDKAAKAMSPAPDPERVAEILGRDPLRRLEDAEALAVAIQLASILPSMLDAVARAASTHAFSDRGVQDDLVVAVNTTEVKTEGTPHSLTRIQLQLNEEGLEWVAESGGGGDPVNWKLMPE